MAVVSPPGFLQNAGNVHTAEILRGAITGLIVGQASTSSLRARGGVKFIGNRLTTQQAGSPNMSVDVLTGQAYVSGTEGGTQAVYHVVNASTTNVAIAASDPTNPRIDLIVVRVQDQFYSGGSNTATIERVAGTPAGSPTAPAAPNNSLILYQVLVGAGVTSIVNANLTDLRTYFAAEGGSIVCTSTTRPTASLIPDGQIIYETDTQLHRNEVGAGTGVWRMMEPYKVQTLLGSTTASITFSNIPTDLRSLQIRWTARCMDANDLRGLQMRVNGVSSADYYGEDFLAGGAAVAAGALNAQTSGNLGLLLGNTAQAGFFAHGNVNIYGWNIAHPLCWTHQAIAIANLTGNAWTNQAGGLFNSTGPFTSLTFFPSVNSFAAGTEIQIIGWD